ncbi:LLM class flavin-dependent oxidoreductase [Mycobacterium sp. M26]|uniref:LLM class flavin-dependent oxidoreductase n=1 Tax=Mycobacterium sp. M26 TaxID=1762962 RepID=UPI00073E73F1|nr:LLM class flavin-dependent oxidoreductase [Mycobacterium sp. M26]
MSGPRFGVWAPVYGNHGARNHPDDLPDPSYRRNRDLLVRAEQAGFDATLVAQHVIHPSDTENDVLETWSTLAALAEATSTIELIGAVKPLLFNPLVFAKIAANIADIADGRLSINVVTGWFLPELEALGIDPLAHDDRYAYTTEWLDTVVDLWRGKQVAIGDGHGQQALVRPVPQEIPPIYVGGELPDTVELIEDLRGRPRDREPLRFGLSAFVIARETEAQAKAEEAHLQALIDSESRPEISSGTDPNTAMYQVLAGTRRIGSNGGTLAGLVGSYEQVIERIDAFHEAGVELFMLQFQPIEAELDRFADNIIAHYR